MNKKAPVYRISCVTRNKYLANQLFRVVLVHKNEIKIEEDTHLMGRGAYIEKDLKIILLGQKRNSLSKSLRHQVDDSIYIELIKKLERK